MFTGIITRLGKVVAYKLTGDSCVIKIEIKDIKISLGESIACDGVCLTVSAILGDDVYEFAVSSETLRCTNLSVWKKGYICNIELALEVGSRLNGHFVSGHVDDVATINSIENKAGYIAVELVFNAAPFVVAKGSIAINGVSLTVNRINNKYVDLMLIPHTVENTNLQYLKAGYIVNIEYDMLYKMVQQNCEKYLEK